MSSTDSLRFKVRTLSVIQPSFLPWRGYFSIIAQSDCFVFYDDVQYDRHGWRNRNRIKTSQGLQWISVPVESKDHFQRAIRDTKICDRSPWRRKILQSVRHAYSRSPFFDAYYAWLERRLLEPWDTISQLDIALTQDVCAFLNVKVQFACSSEIPTAQNLDRVERLVALCRHFSCDRYLSGPSARDYLVDSDSFSRNGIVLEYARYSFQPYPQLFGEFLGEVSVIDTLFNLGPNASSALVPANTGPITNPTTSTSTQTESRPHV